MGRLKRDNEIERPQQQGIARELQKPEPGQLYTAGSTEGLLRRGEKKKEVRGIGELMKDVDGAAWYALSKAFPTKQAFKDYKGKSITFSCNSMDFFLFPDVDVNKMKVIIRPFSSDRAIYDEFETFLQSHIKGSLKGTMEKYYNDLKQ